MKQVVISVSGGVAEIAYASEDVEVAIVDFDDAEAEGKSCEQKLRYWVARARRDEKKTHVPDDQTQSADTVRGRGARTARGKDMIVIIHSYQEHRGDHIAEVETPVNLKEGETLEELTDRVLGKGDESIVIKRIKEY